MYKSTNKISRTTPDTVTPYRIHRYPVTAPPITSSHMARVSTAVRIRRTVIWILSAAVKSLS